MCFFCLANVELNQTRFECSNVVKLNRFLSDLYVELFFLLLFEFVHLLVVVFASIMLKESVFSNSCHVEAVLGIKRFEFFSFSFLNFF